MNTNKNFLMTTDLQVVTDYLAAAPVVAFDFETAPQQDWQGDGTAALDPHRGEIVGISLAVAPTAGENNHYDAIYIPLGHHDPEGLGLNADAAAVLALLRERLFENPAITKVAHNLAFEAKFLLARGITLVAPVYDTMLAAMLIYKEEGRFRRLADVGLKSLAREWLGQVLPGFVAVVGVGSFADLDPRDPATIDYAGHDAAVALQLYALERDWFAAQLPAHGSLAAELESPVALFTARMEYHGVLLDGPGLTAAAAAAEQQLAAVLAQLATIGRRPVQVGKNAATNDLKAYLFADLGLPVLKTTDSGRPSVDAEAILGLRDYCRDHAPEQLPYLEAISCYRGLAKLHKTYLQGLADQRNPATGAVHTQFFQLGAETGRFTSARPNCQNLPAGPLYGITVRDLLIARPGTSLVAVDYSQIELRIGAWFTRDPNLLAVYRDGGDIHAVTTAAIYGISLAEASDSRHPDYKARRSVAKNINFGIFYGLYPRGLQDLVRLKAGLKLSREACEAMIFNLKRAYPELGPWQEAVKAAACYRETVDTALGRRRALPGINAPEPALQSHFERAALNHPIQGTAADILKLAMVRLTAGLPAWPEIKPLLTVHDEIVFEVDNDRLAEAIPWLTTVMAAPPWPAFDVPLAVAVTVGTRYGTMEGWAGAGME